LTSRSTLEKSVPEMVSLSGGNLESWQQGQNVELGPDVSVQVLHPASDSSETHAEDRALVLLFRSGGGTLLWAGKIGAQARADILAAYPDLHVDILVMGTEPPPDEGWLRALHVRYWLQIPPRDRQLNSNQESLTTPSCEVWTLSQTGAVDVRFKPDKESQLPVIEMRPWLAAPAK
jgi:hypothetical protein